MDVDSNMQAVDLIWACNKTKNGGNDNPDGIIVLPDNVKKIPNDVLN